MNVNCKKKQLLDFINDGTLKFLMEPINTSSNNDLLEWIAVTNLIISDKESKSKVKFVTTATIGSDNLCFSKNLITFLERAINLTTSDNANKKKAQVYIKFTVEANNVINVSIEPDLKMWSWIINLCKKTTYGFEDVPESAELQN